METYWRFFVVVCLKAFKCFKLANSNIIITIVCMPKNKYYQSFCYRKLMKRLKVNFHFTVIGDSSMSNGNIKNA